MKVVSTLKINKKTSTKILRNYMLNNKPTTFAFQIPRTELLSAVPYYNFRKAVNYTYLRKNGGNSVKVVENVRYVNDRNSIWVSLYLLLIFYDDSMRQDFLLKTTIFEERVHTSKKKKCSE